MDSKPKASTPQIPSGLKEAYRTHLALRDRLPELVEIYLRSDDPNHRDAAWDAFIIFPLDDAPNPRAVVEKIVPILEDGTDTEAVARALLLLRMMGPSAKDAVPAIIRFIRQHHEWAFEAAAVLGYIGPEPGVIPELLWLQKVSNNPMAVTAADKALGRLKVREGIPGIAMRLRSAKAYFRVNAAEAIGLMGWAPAKVRQILVAAASDDSNAVRAKAVWALGRVGDTSSPVAEALAKALSDKEEQVGLAAAEAVGDLGLCTEDIVRGLVKRSGSGSIWTTLAARQALTRVGWKRTAMLSAVLEEPQWTFSERRLIAFALAKTSRRGANAIAAAVRPGGRGAFAAMLAMREAEWNAEFFVSGIVRGLSAQGLEVHALETAEHLNLRDEKIVAGAIRILTDEHGGAALRAEAAETLGVIGSASAQAKRALTQSLQSDSAMVVDSARKALESWK